MNIIKYAAIDIGSNAIRMLIANVIFKDNKSYIFKNSLIRLPIRLGEDSFTKGHISESKILDLIDAFKSFKLIMKIHNVSQYKVYATSALRESSNKMKIVESVFNKSKIKIEIINGTKEAMIISKTNIFKNLDYRLIYMLMLVEEAQSYLLLMTQKLINQNHLN